MSKSSDRNKAEIFLMHVQNHLDKGQKVICKICNMTIDEVVKEETGKGIWIADAVYDTQVEYIDRNGKKFKIVEVK